MLCCGAVAKSSVNGRVGTLNTMAEYDYPSSSQCSMTGMCYPVCRMVFYHMSDLI